MRDWKLHLEDLGFLGFRSNSITVYGDVWSDYRKSWMFKHHAASGWSGWQYKLTKEGETPTDINASILVAEAYHKYDISELPQDTPFLDRIREAKLFYSIPADDMRRISDLGFDWYDEPRKGQLVVTRNGDIWNLYTKERRKPAIKPAGDYEISLMADFSKCSVRVKRLMLRRVVAMAFCPIPEEFVSRGYGVADLRVEHIDGDKSNHKASNLRWVAPNSDTHYDRTILKEPEYIMDKKSYVNGDAVRSLRHLGFSSYSIDLFGHVYNMRREGRMIKWQYRSNPELEQVTVVLFDDDGNRCNEYVGRLIFETFKDVTDYPKTPWKEYLQQAAYYDSIPDEDKKDIADIGYDWYRTPRLGKYYVTKNGDVFDDYTKRDRTRWNARCKCSAVELPTNPSVRKRPSKEMLVHHLVADAFLPKPKSDTGEEYVKCTLKFIDGNSMNSRLDNLVWVRDDRYETLRADLSDEEYFRLRKYVKPLNELGFPMYTINILGEVWNHALSQPVNARIPASRRMDASTVTLVNVYGEPQVLSIYQLIIALFVDVNLDELNPKMLFYKHLVWAKEFSKLDGNNCRDISEIGVDWYREIDNARIVVTTSGEIWNTRTKRPYVCKKMNDGYLRLSLPAKKAKSQSAIRGIPVHRLVCLAFHEIPERLRERGFDAKTLTVNHIDGNKENNHVSNLEWCTMYENHMHSTISREYPDEKLTASVIGEILDELHSNVPIKQISEVSDVRDEVVERIAELDSYGKVE